MNAHQTNAPGRHSKKAARERGAWTMLPYARHYDDATLITRDGQLVQFLHLRGLPFETADADELNYRKSVRDGVLRAIATPRLSLYHHVIRRQVSPQLEGRFANRFARLLDAGWRARMSERRLFVNDLFFTLVRRPLLASNSLFGAAAKRSAAEAGAETARGKRELEAARDALLAALEPYGARLLSPYECDGEIHSEPLEFLSCLFNGEMAPIKPKFADPSHDVAGRRVSFGGDAIEFSATGEFERAFGSIIAIKEYPPATAAGQFDALYRLPHELIVTQSFTFAPRQNALNRMNLTLRRLRAADDEAISLQRDLAQAKDDVAAGRAVFGEHHQTVLVRAPTLQALDEAVAEVTATLAECGALGVRETIALEPSFWAQFPGNERFIARRALISSANFSGLASCHNHPLGAEAGNHWGSAVAMLETTAASPYYFNFHQGDLGNFLIIGPSGSGKTVALNFLLAQAQRFAPRTIFFDKDRGGEIFVRAIGGRYDVIRPGTPTGFNPLQLPDTPINRRFLADWTAKLLTSHGEALSADDMHVITDAVAANFEQHPRLRRLRYFRELFAGARRPSSGDLAARLGAWVEGGDKGWLFDNGEDQLSLEAHAVGFDMTQVLDDPIARTPVMFYLFHRVEERLDGAPAIIVVDEGWKALDDDVFVARIRDWEKTIRKRNGIVGFATQSASDALESRIASAIIEQSPTQIFMPNSKAQERDYVQGFGLTAHEFAIVRSLSDASRCFLIKQGAQSVVARLNLNGFNKILKVLSGRERSVRELDQLRAELGDDPAHWLPRLVAGARA